MDIDWESKSVVNAISAWATNGLGPGQCDDYDSQNKSRMCVYLARISDSISENVFLADVRTQLVHDCPEILASDIWVTDFIGYQFITIAVSLFPFIPEILNAVLKAGHWFVTHPTVKVSFKPGEVFTLETFEAKVIASMRESFELFSRNRNVTWASLDPILPVWRLAKEQNWSTREGLAFAREIKHSCEAEGHELFLQDVCRLNWPSYQQALRENNILEAGGWTRNELAWTDEEEEEEEDSCMICLDRTPTTTVMPCGHRVVCDECSSLLSDTNDNRTCVACRRPITHVFYKEGNRVEQK